MSTPGFDRPRAVPADIEARLLACPDLPSLPAVALKVVELCKDPEAGLPEVTEVIVQDPALAARLLRIANSPLYGLRRQSENLRQALSLLGLDATLMLALGFSLRLTTGTDQSTVLDTQRYWRRALLAAAACRAIGHQRKGGLREELFLAGLLQDIGMLVLERVMPDDYRPVLADAEDHERLVGAERSQVGVDHAEVGAWLMRQWRLPEYLYWTTLASNDPSAVAVPQAYTDMARCVAVSGYLAEVWLASEAQPVTDRALTAAGTWLGMTGAEYQAVLDTMAADLPALAELFETDLVEPVRIAGILAEAKDLLSLSTVKLMHTVNQTQQRVDVLETRTRQLEVQSRVDGLTGLYNRHQLEVVLNREFATANEGHWPLSLAFLDLDHFKQINDHYGHPVGDQVLVTFARLLRHQLRQTDHVARYGGEEFVIVLPGTGQGAAQALLERLLTAVRALAVEVGAHQVLRVITSIGLATHGDEQRFADAEALLQAADKALYAAKREGRDRLALTQVQSRAALGR